MLANKATVPDYAMAKLEAIADLHAQAVARAYEHGVTIAMGTDIALTVFVRPNAWGQNEGSRARLPGQAGPVAAGGDRGGYRVRAAHPRPAGAAHGQLAEGYDADVITLDADPLADIGMLADPARITARVSTGDIRSRAPRLRPAGSGRRGLDPQDQGAAA